MSKMKWDASKRKFVPVHKPTLPQKIGGVLKRKLREPVLKRREYLSYEEDRKRRLKKIRQKAAKKRKRKIRKMEVKREQMKPTGFSDLYRMGQLRMMRTRRKRKSKARKKKKRRRQPRSLFDMGLGV